MNNNDNLILLILMKKFNNDISIYIYDIYLIDKYFSNGLNNKSIQLFKNRYFDNNEKINKIINIINPNFLNIYYMFPNLP